MEYSSIFNFCSVTSANLTKVYRMKEFFSSFFSSANIIVRAKVNITRSVSTLFPLAGRKLHGTLYPGRRFACRWAMNFCPFGTCCKRASYKQLSACEKICADLCDPWACSPTCFFKRIERLGYSHRSHRFAQISPYGQCAFAESR